jgi:hypothetical protein
MYFFKRRFEKSGFGPQTKKLTVSDQIKDNIILLYIFFKISYKWTFLDEY